LQTLITGHRPEDERILAVVVIEGHDFIDLFLDETVDVVHLFLISFGIGPVQIEHPYEIVTAPDVCR
jgi:hypothetical protein